MVHPPHPATEPYSLTHLPLPPSEVRRLFSKPKVSRTYPTFTTAVTHHADPPLKMEYIQCSETLAFKLQTLENYPQESI
jgi:hypothetical protein